MQRGLRVIYCFCARNEFVRSIHGWAVKAEITHVVALVKQNVEESRKRGICVGVKPNLHGEEIRRAVMFLYLFRGAKRDVGLPTIRVPTLAA